MERMNFRVLAFIFLAVWIGKADQLPTIPVPAGPFGIGRVGYDWIDGSRRLPRELMVYFWYPTSNKSAETRGAYLPGARQMDSRPETRAPMVRAFDDKWPSIVSGAIFSHAAEGVPAAKSPRQFPVILFSHGLGSTGFNYTCLIEDLVSRGYVVAAIEHTGVAKVVWFPDGRVMAREEKSTEDLIEEGAADVRFVLDHLSKVNGEGTHFLLTGRLDLRRVAAMGHSAGAEFAARACQLDRRFRACVDLDGGMVPVAALPISEDGATLNQPLLFIEAYHAENQMAATHEQVMEYLKKKNEQLQSCPVGSYAVVLKSPGIAHPSFSDVPLLFAGQNGYPEIDVVRHNLDLIERFTREFLGKQLKHEKAPLLDGSKRLAEASVEPLPSAQRR
jgi:pimeloyl-ACP methyl ester carboxylesterase